VKTLVVLNLGDNLDMCSLLGKKLSDIFNIGGLSNERGSNEINVIFNTEFEEIVLILVSQSWEINDDTWQVHVLSLTKSAVVVALNHDVIL